MTLGGEKRLFAKVRWTVARFERVGDAAGNGSRAGKPSARPLALALGVRRSKKVHWTFSPAAPSRLTLTDTRPGETFSSTYNVRNRPVSVTRNSVAYATYVYNGLEQLVSRSTSAPGGPSGTIHYVYDLAGHLIAEADGSTGAITREYIWMDDLPVGLVQGGNLYMVHTDHLARPIRITDASHATQWQATWGPWGEPQSISGTLALDMRFPGQLYQIETGLRNRLRLP